ncbi:MAG: hypothetical protein MR316_04650 [Lachnospiraceae bacterium]|nr:hypothetical protein [Lachnospiraceae bacterium]
MVSTMKEVLSKDDKAMLREKIEEIAKNAVSVLDPTADMSDEERQQYEQKIIRKLKMGKRLTTEEMQYLQTYNPALYRTALRVQMAKERLQKQLENCKSKEEANDAISSAISGISDKDPDREYLAAGLQETAKNFRQDSRYARLPNTKEEAARKKGREYAFDDGDEKKQGKSYSPIIEVIESLPSFNTVS